MSVCLKPGKIIVLLGMLAAFMLSDFARAEVEWQTYPGSTGEFNGTVPIADSASVPVYQGSVQLDPAASHDVAFSAKPNEFSVDDDAANLIVANPQDSEGDQFFYTTCAALGKPDAADRQSGVGGCRHAGYAAQSTAHRQPQLLRARSGRAFAGGLATD